MRAHEGDSGEHKVPAGDLEQLEKQAARLRELQDCKKESNVGAFTTSGVTLVAIYPCGKLQNYEQASFHPGITASTGGLQVLRYQEFQRKMDYAGPAQHADTDATYSTQSLFDIELDNE